MDGIGNPRPARDMRIGVDARRAFVATADVGGMRALGDDKATLGGALAVVIDHHGARGVIGVGAQPGGRRMHDAVLERDSQG